MKKTITNVPASVRKRLENKARADNVSFQSLLQFYAMERFLFRLANSQNAQHFILKGGLVYLGWPLDIRRPTMDIDFQGTPDINEENSIKMFKNICAQKDETDGIVFLPESITATAIQAENEKPGIRIKFQAMLDGAKIPMRVDISFGSVITPNPISIKYPTIFSNAPLDLQGYPPETVIAEKYESIVSLGLANSRLKDIYDLRMLIENLEFQSETLLKAITATFQMRDTNIPENVFSFDISEFAKKNQRDWETFITRNTSPQSSFLSASSKLNRESIIPQSLLINKESKADLGDVLRELSTFFSPLIKFLKDEKKVRKKWNYRQGWY